MPAPRGGAAWPWLAAAAAVIIVAYLPWAWGEFVYDDYPIILDNPYLRFDAFSRFFAHGLWTNSSLKLAADNLYRPFILIWFTLLKAVAGDRAWFFHLVNLILLAGNALMIAALVRRWVPEAGVKTQVAAVLLYGLHPLHVQTVVWAGGGIEVLFTALFLGSLLSYICAEVHPSKRELVGSLSLYTLALLTKESAALLPLVLLLHDWSVRKRLFWRSYALYGVVFAFYAMARSTVASSSGLQLDLAGMERLAEFTVLAGRHVLFPWPQPVWFDYPAGGMAAPIDWVLGGLFLLTLGWAVIRHKQIRLPVLMAVLAFLPPLLVAFHPGKGVFALRFLSLPLTGLVVAGAALITVAAESRTRAFAFAVGVVALVAVAGVAVEARQWKNDDALGAKFLATVPASAAGYNLRAAWATRNGKANEALVWSEKAVGSAAGGEPRAHALENLALAYKGLERYPDSLAAYRQMTDTSILHYRALAWVGVGNNLWVLGRLDEALDAYRKADFADPENFLAVYNLGNILETMGRPDEAAAWYEQALALPVKTDWPEAEAGQAHAREFLRGRR